MHASARARTYWACQLAGWGLYLGLNAVLLGRAQGGAVVPPLAVACGTGLGLTHLLRRGWGQRWSALPVARLLPRVALASVVMSALVNALGLALTLALAPGRPFSATVLLVLLFNWGVVFLVWQLLYFGVHLVERSRQTELAAYQLRAAAQAAELRALKAQLNPHFLFNSLNSLRALIAEDPARAQQMVTQLAGLLRYALRAGAEEVVPLERELEVVRDYLALEGVRFEERLRVRIEVEPGCLRVPVPALLVQSLVENGIKHGVARCPEGGEIGVRAFRDGASLRLEVSNPPAAPAAPSAAGEGGLGLANATERLHLLFGQGAALSLDRSRADRVVAEVRLPWTA